MLATFRQYLHRRRSIATQRRSLVDVGRLVCPVEHLRELPESAVEGVFSDSRLDGEWEGASGELGAVCRIADGTTGGVNPGDRRALWYLVRHFRPRSVLEIGTHVGASTAHIALALRQAAGEEPTFDPRMVTVDMVDVNDPGEGYWKRAGLEASPAGMVEALRCGGFVEFATARSVDFLDDCAQRFDLVFLDGDHSAATVYQEVPRALRVLAPGGLLLLHDYFPGNRPLWPDGKVMPGPWLAVERLRGEGAPLQVIPLGELPWPTKLGSRVTSLALVGRS